MPTPEFAPLNDEIKSTDLLKDFKKNYPNALSMNQSLIIKMGFKKLPALGMCAYNIENNHIAISLLTTTGMKLIEAEKIKEKIKVLFVMPGLMKNQNNAKNLIKDVQSIYFHPCEKPTSCEVSKYNIIYTFKESQHKKVKLFFGKTKNDNNIKLRIKQIFDNDRVITEVYYYKYKKNIPIEIGLKNIKFNYSLQIKTREIFGG